VAAIDVPPFVVPVTGVEPAAAAPAMAGVASSESPLSGSSRVEGWTGAPLADTTSCGCEGVTAGAGAEAAATGGVPLPESGNASPPDLPPVDLDESALRLGFAEARWSAPAKSRAPVALEEGSAAWAALGAAA
jgi:hypothetical protein